MNTIHTHPYKHTHTRITRNLLFPGWCFPSWARYDKKEEIKEKSSHILWWTLIKLQSANVPSCALISKKIPTSSYSLPCVTLVQWDEPRGESLMVGSFGLKRCGPQTLRSEHCVSKRGLSKNKMKSKSKTQIRLSLLDGLTLLQVVPVFVLQLCAHF